MVGAAFVLACAAPAASAYTGPVTHPQNIDDVLGYLTKGSPNAGQIPGIDVNSPRVADWWEAEHRPLPGQPSSSQLHDDLKAARSRLGLLPKLGTFAKFTLAGAAATVAIEYGPQLFQEIGLWPKPPAGPQQWEPVEIQLYEVGEYLGQTGSLGSGFTYGFPEFRNSVKVGIFTATGTTLQSVFPTVFNTPAEGLSPQDWIQTPSGENGNSNCGALVAVPPLNPPARRWFAGQGSPPVDRATVPIQAPPPSFCDNPPAGLRSAYAVAQRMTESESRLVPETDAPVVLQAPADWAGECTTRACVEGALEEVLDDFPDLARYLEHLIDPSKPNPYPAPAKVIVPDCDGLLWPACRDLLEEAGLEPQREQLDWQGAVIEKPAGAIVETRPGPGAEVDTGAAVTVIVNPNEDGMPLVVPEPSSDPNEHYQTYVEKLADAGFPEPVIKALTETTADTAKGPNAVVAVQPPPGSRFDPSKPPPQVTVEHNPPSMPIVGPGGGCELPSVRDVEFPSIDWGNKFPFGAPGWFAATVAQWETQAAPPLVTFDLTPDIEWEIDLAATEPMLDKIRPVVLLVSTIGIIVAALAAASATWARFAESGNNDEGGGGQK